MSEARATLPHSDDAERAIVMDAFGGFSEGRARGPALGAILDLQQPGTSQ